MYVDGNENNNWFNINEMEKMTFKIRFIPLFNAVSDLNHDVWDDMFFGEINMVIMFFEEYDRYENEAVSFDFPFAPKNVTENIYEINFEISIEDFKSNISHARLKNKKSIYSVRLSYYVKDLVTETTNVFQILKDNTIFKTYIPFNENGDWLNG